MKNNLFSSWWEPGFDMLVKDIFNYTSESKKEKNKSHLFCEGEFIKNDIHGNPCYVGDRLRITRPRIYFKRDVDVGWGYDTVDLKEKVFEGTLVLLKTKGLHLKLDNGTYYHLTITNKARNPLKWEKV